MWMEKTGSVGITDYAQSSLGDIVFVELPKVGEAVTAGDHLRFGREREGGERSICAGFRHGDGDQ